MTRAAVPETLIVKASLAAASTLVTARPSLAAAEAHRAEQASQASGSDRVHSLTIDARWREVAKERQDVTPDQPT
jgi:hypothetical protein